MGKGQRPRIEPIIQDTICNHCHWAKDRVNNRHVVGCYCVHYGYIVSKLKERCSGYKPEGVKKDDGNTTGSGNGDFEERSEAREF